MEGGGRQGEEGEVWRVRDVRVRVRRERYGG